MKYKLLTYLLSVGISSTMVASTEDKIVALGKSYEGITEEINKLPDNERQKAYDLLREQVGAMGHGMGYYLDGSNAVNEQRGQSWLVEQVYHAFMAEQGHLERAIIHTGENKLATRLIGDRTLVFCRMFPLGQSGNIGESLSFTVCLANSCLHNPKQVTVAIESQLTRWKGQDRLPVLLILAENGNKTFQPEVDSYTSELVNKVKITFITILDHGHSK